MSRDEILAQLRAHKPVLERRFGIVELALFGWGLPDILDI